MIDLKTDKVIIEAATDGPWYATPILQNTMIIHEHGEHETQEVCEVYEDSNIDYIAHFNPTKMREYIATAEREAKQAERIRELEVSLCEATINLVDADNLAKVIDEQVMGRNIDVRSAIADARLDYGEPHNYKWLQLLAKSKPEER